MLKKKEPNPIDVVVGSRIRMRRTMLRMSQTELGGALSITFQQVQKYEKGTNRVGASRLQAISATLQVPISYFFEGAPAASRDDGQQADGSDELLQFISTTEGYGLNHAFARIKDIQVRRKIVALSKALAAD